MPRLELPEQMHRSRPRHAALHERPAMSAVRLLLTFLLLMGSVIGDAMAVDYDVVYVRQPRFGDFQNTIWPEIFHPGRIDPGADLMLLHPDGSEEVLVNSQVCSVKNPILSFNTQ